MIFQDQNILSKTQNQFHNFSRSWKFWFFRISQWPVDRQSTGTRPTCTNFVHVSISRPGLDRYSTDPNLLLSGNVQSTDPVDRQFKSRWAVDWQSTGQRVLLSGSYRSTEPVDRWLQRSEKWPLAGRPAVDRQLWQNPNGSFSGQPI